MKTFIFAVRDARMTHYEIDAPTPAEAIRKLVAAHGIRSYRIVNIIGTHPAK